MLQNGGHMLLIFMENIEGLYANKQQKGSLLQPYILKKANN
jgi:hypothetical protein